MKPRKVLQKIPSVSKDVAFSDVAQLVEAFGFDLARMRGSHHIFTHPGIPEPVNFQDMKGRAKPYQIRRFIRLVERYNLDLGE